jgi:CheY-like chemotaxis protein
LEKRFDGLRVLYVEDEALVALVVRGQLEDFGFEVHVAADGAQALDLLGAEKWDLVFSDIRLPGPVDGLAIARTAELVDPNLPVLLCTGFAGEAADHLPAGVTILQKPFTQADLEEACSLALGRF